MQNTGQNDSPPSLNPANEPDRENPPVNDANSPGKSPSRAEQTVGKGIKIDTSGMSDDADVDWENEGGASNPPVSEDDFADIVRGLSDMNEATNKPTPTPEGTSDPYIDVILGDEAGEVNEAWSDKSEEAKFIEVNGGPSGRLLTPEEAGKIRVDTLESIRKRVEGALQRFGKVTKQSHVVDRLVGCLTPLASKVEHMPFTPSATRNLASRNRDDHILHLAGSVIEAWGVAMRYGSDGLGRIDELRYAVTQLEDVVQDRRLYKAYPVDRHSSLYTLRLITDQVKLNQEAEDAETKRAERLSGEAPVD